MPATVDGRMVALTEAEYYRDQRFLEYSNLIHGRWKDFDWFSRLMGAIQQKQLVLTSRNSELIHSAGFRVPSAPLDTVVLFGVNLPRNIVTMLADFMVNTPPTIRIRKGGAEKNKEEIEKANQAIAEMLNTTRFWSTFWEAVVDLSAYGGGWIKLVPEQFGEPGNVAEGPTGSPIGFGQKVKYVIQNPRHVFVTPKAMNRKEPDNIEIRFPFFYGEREYLYVETHRPESIEITAYEFEERHRVIEDPFLYMEKNQVLKKDPVPGMVQQALGIVPGIYPNPLAAYRDVLNDPFLLQYYPNFRAGDEYYGFSDFEGHEGVFDEIVHRMSMLSRGQDLTDDPKCNADEENFQRLPDGPPVFQMSGARVFMRGKDGKGVEPIVWDQKIEEKWIGIEKLILRLLSASEVSLDLVAPDLTGGKGGADSGIAMNFRLIPTIGKRDRVRRYANESLSDTLKKSLILTRPMKRKAELPAAPIAKDALPMGFDIQWNESVVKDRDEEVAYWNKRIAAGLSTRVEAIMALDGVTQDEAQTRLDAIVEEQKRMLPEPLKAGLGVDSDLEPTEEEETPE